MHDTTNKILGGLISLLIHKQEKSENIKYKNENSFEDFINIIPIKIENKIFNKKNFVDFVSKTKDKIYNGKIEMLEIKYVLFPKNKKIVVTREKLAKRQNDFDLIFDKFILNKLVDIKNIKIFMMNSASLK